MSEIVDAEVLTAVEFLCAINKKGHAEGTLKKYLRNRRNLTDKQISLAFEIFTSRLERSSKPKVIAPEGIPKHSLLLTEKRGEGEILIENFLRTEKTYCKVIKCLIGEYWTCLSEMADQKKIKISRTELEPIFQRLQHLSRFHQSFLTDISSQEVNFGRMFIQNFAGFRDYIQYTKVCRSTVETMQKYINDKKLSKALGQIRVASRRPNDDMMDLILLPLDHIKQYKEFIDSLCQYADKNQESSYELLEKASRRIGRVVKWIAAHKHGIINCNEMNKVQQFLRNQCRVIGNNRRIVRRGMMTRRTTTWPARNKRYIFFLFNDVLLWTTRKGDLQNVVLVSDCEVQNSESTTNRARKFEVVVNYKDSRKSKLLKLECNSLRQRTEWFDSLKKEISTIKKGVEETARSKPAEDEFIKWIARFDEEKKTRDFTGPTAETQGTYEFKKNESSYTNEDEEEESEPAHQRYELSKNFWPKEVEDAYLPLDDNVSVTSTGAQEVEQAFSDEKSQNYGDSINALFPNRPKRHHDSKAVLSENIGPYSPNGRNIRSLDSASSDVCPPPSQLSNVSHLPTSNIIVRQRHVQSLANLKKESSLTMSLSDLL